ncbi:MAG: pseudouridine synthase [Betaproteobacteria bacterium]|nr:pseudouridine synthase [Betaproteobacteria bacterium]
MRPGRGLRSRSSPAPGRASVVLLNKPYGVLCQFTSPDGRRTLADYVVRPGVYPAGRLDADSEGLVVLTADGALQTRIADPRHRLAKTYWVEVEGAPGDEAIAALERGVVLRDGPTLPARVRRIAPPPGLWPRDPPIRVRKAIPTAWLEIAIAEGRNRQVRRMTAAVGLPTLRLVRQAVGPWTLGTLAPGQWREEVVDARVLTSAAASTSPAPAPHPRPRASRRPA